MNITISSPQNLQSNLDLLPVVISFLQDPEKESCARVSRAFNAALEAQEKEDILVFIDKILTQNLIENPAELQRIRSTLRARLGAGIPQEDLAPKFGSLFAIRTLDPPSYRVSTVIREVIACLDDLSPHQLKTLLANEKTSPCRHILEATDVYKWRAFGDDYMVIAMRGCSPRVCLELIRNNHNISDRVLQFCIKFLIASLVKDQRWEKVCALIRKGACITPYLDKEIVCLAMFGLLKGKKVKKEAGMIRSWMKQGSCPEGPCSLVVERLMAKKKFHIAIEIATLIPCQFERNILLTHIITAIVGNVEEGVLHNPF